MNLPTIRLNDGLSQNKNLAPAVKSLQETLIRLGVKTIQADGKFGGGTEVAVKEFQAKHNLPADGTVGTGTWDALVKAAYRTLHPGDQIKDRSCTSDIKFLQEKLNAAGCNVGTPDGQFGPGVAKQVKAFQGQHGLPADGVVGSGTWLALLGGKAPGAAEPGIKFESKLASPITIADVFQCPLSQTQTYLPGVLKAMDKWKILDRLTLIGLCATIRIETGGFQPINEMGGTKYFTKMYEGRKDLGNTQKGDGARFHGRGYVQITGRANYAEYGKKLGISNQLVSNPELALSPVYAAEIIARYFKDRGVDAACRAKDWRKARKLVNGGYNGWEEFKKYVDRGLSRM